MDLKSELEKIMSRTRECVGLFIMDKDGLVVERAEAKGDHDLEMAFVEMMQSFRSAIGMAASVGDGTVKELSILTDRHRYLFRRINDDYFLALAMTPNGYHGEGVWRMCQVIAATSADFAV
jgi:predicted regulator of Ras-like GTPase activity (Roadblock/LC7/MglB family)